MYLQLWTRSSLFEYWVQYFIHWNRHVIFLYYIFITSYICSCQNCNFWGSQRWKFHQNDNISISVFTKRLSFHPGLNVLQGLTWHQSRPSQDEWVESLGSAKLGQSSQYNMVHEVDAARSRCMHDQVIFFSIFYFTIYSFIYSFFYDQQMLVLMA